MSFKNYHFFSGINEISRGAGNVPVLVGLYLKKKPLVGPIFLPQEEPF